MEKTIELSIDAEGMKNRIDKFGRVYLYRVANVSLDKVTLEKHLSAVKNTFDGKNVLSVKINDETKVGTVTQKLDSVLIASISKKVDEVAVNFIMGEKVIESIDFSGVMSA